MAYTITWPLGLSMGQSESRARHLLDTRRGSGVTLQASPPHIEIDDAFASRSDGEMSSETFEEHVRHGARRSGESLRSGSRELERTNPGAPNNDSSGRTPVGNCARDTSVHLWFLRRDLATGRIPAPGCTYVAAGSGSDLCTHVGWAVANEYRLADEIRVVVRGPASEDAWSPYSTKHPARTLLPVRAEFEEGPLSMRLLE